MEENLKYSVVPQKKLIEKMVKPEITIHRIRITQKKKVRKSQLGSVPSG